MKLLALIHRLPCPPDRGAKLRAAAELSWLTRRHDVWCAGFIDPPGPAESRDTIQESLAKLRRDCRALAAIGLNRPMANIKAMANLCRGKTATEAYFASWRLRRQVLQWSRQVQFDAVLAFSSGMAPLALEVPAPRHVCDFVDLDSRKWDESAWQASWPMSWVYRTEAERLARREREWISAFDASVLCNQREADLVAGNSLRDRVHVIETGASFDVDPQETHSAAKTSDELSEQASDDVSLPAEPVVGFVGAMDYPPNVDGVCWFTEAIWPRVLQGHPDARWWIVGRSPTRTIRDLDDGQRIRVTGTVPAVEPYLSKMRVNVAPLRLARGVQTKVLTAMAAGRPCVVTPCVADGIGADAGREIVVAESPEAFALAVGDLLTDRSRAEAIGQAGRRFVHRRYRPADGLKRLEQWLGCDVPARGVA